MPLYKPNQPLHVKQRVGFVDDDWLVAYNRGRRGLLVLAEKRDYATIEGERRWHRKTMETARKMADLRWIKRQLWERKGIDPPIEELPEDEWRDI